MRITNNNASCGSNDINSIKNGIDQILEVLNTNTTETNTTETNTTDTNTTDTNTTDTNTTDTNTTDTNTMEIQYAPFIEDNKLKTFSLSFQTGALLEYSSDGKEFKFSLENITKPTLNSNLVPRNVVMPGFSADDFKEILANEQIQEQIKGLDIGFMVHTPEMNTFQFVKKCEDIQVIGDVGSRMLHVKFPVAIDTMFLQQIMTFAGPSVLGAHVHIDVEWQDNTPGYENKVNKMINALPEKYFTSVEGPVPFVSLVRQNMLLIDGDNNNIDGKYYYTSVDFKGQDYVQTENIVRAEFMVPIKDSLDNNVGWISWQSLAYPPESNEKWAVQENMTISFGNDNDAYTYNGSALSLASNGYYEMQVPYKFCAHGCDDELYVTITKVSDTMREVVVSHTNSTMTMSDDNELKTFSLSYQTGAFLGSNSDGTEIRFLLKDITKPTLNSNLVPVDTVMTGLSASDFQMILSDESLWSRERINIDPQRRIPSSIMIHTPEMKTFQVVGELKNMFVTGQDPETREIHITLNERLDSKFLQDMMEFAGPDVPGAHVHVDFEWQDSTPVPFNSVYQIMNALPEEYFISPTSFLSRVRDLMVSYSVARAQGSKVSWKEYRDMIEADMEARLQERGRGDFTLQYNKMNQKP